ncbi:16S rRNA (adenine(1518)-N(6)/adenine(1519)-N(6))-dimethyltransferase RsmA [Acidisoma cellulosilytica]|uniref:Ribosomal RNA small subunit methyltransferase A n=1 Tax=Acidisoma cellulosilyticum TaxID=2802395 RepID=A0A963YY23_9PROT|nr:16S rRNA (adenine(1518)-N(6)/adenine(1519)-N(6))-dimethyltransferase RsmA [Acidisoma cellulosilyticum]MCB8878936.1 16S rRNA (adenine(1518)-N(6)/adenine(1519)-N(6))-dimethyltransferase RsmA [Acidisoma cellulosilyticum]
MSEAKPSVTGVSPTLPSLKDVISRHSFRAKHALGQHFLLDLNLTAKIASIAGDLTGRHVIEVGPGPGGLTRALLDSPAETVTVIEIDQRGVAVAEELAEFYPGRLKVVSGDALKMRAADLTPAPRQVIANLPYNVGTPLLIGWLRDIRAYEQLTLMFQEEVAQRIAAAPDTDAYGRLSVLAQWTCRTVLAMSLPPEAFTPPPKVNSAVVRMIPNPVQPEPTLFAAMEKVTQHAFGQRRKMLRASLKPLGGEALLRRAEIEPTRRAETLSVAEFDTLARLVAEPAREA